MATKRRRTGGNRQRGRKVESRLGSAEFLAAVEAGKGDFSGESLYRLGVPGVRLANLNFSGTNLRRADLQDVDFREAEFIAADVRLANLCGADLRGALLWKTNLYEADLRRADLRGACLRQADLRNAKLRGARWAGADVTDAKFSTAALSRIIAVTCSQSDTPYTARDTQVGDVVPLARAQGHNVPLTGSWQSNLGRVTLSRNGQHVVGKYIYREPVGNAVQPSSLSDQDADINEWAVRWTGEIAGRIVDDVLVFRWGWIDGTKKGVGFFRLGEAELDGGWYYDWEAPEIAALERDPQLILDLLPLPEYREWRLTRDEPLT